VIGALARYGDGLGIAFQMADDLLDWGGTSGQIGKNTGDDFRERKLTLPVIRAVAAADAAERAFWVRTIEKGDQGDGDLDHAMEILRRHGTLDKPAKRRTATRRMPVLRWPMCRTRVDRHDGGPGRLRGCAPDLIAARRRARQDGRRPRPTSRAKRAAAVRQPSGRPFIGEEPKQVAPDPLIRARRHPFQPAQRIEDVPDGRNNRASSRFEVVPVPASHRQQAVRIGPFRLGQGAFSTDANALKTGPVGTSTPGFTRTSHRGGIGGTGSRMSPIPRMRAGAQAAQTGMSAPMASKASCGPGGATSHNSTRPRSAAPASADPPPIPPAWGRCFSRAIARLHRCRTPRPRATRGCRGPWAHLRPAAR
jgi:hypothetical protein